MAYLPPPPTFTTAVPLSASAHLNPLLKCTDALGGAYHSWHPPFTAFMCGRPHIDGLWQGWTGDGWLRLWRGAIRHKHNSLSWQLTVNPNAVTGLKARLRYAGIQTPLLTIPNGQTGQRTLSGAIDMSGWGQTRDAFAIVNIDVAPYTGSGGPGSARLDYLYESDGLTHAPLPAFASGAPTAADWQTLSNRVTTLTNQLLAPRPAFIGGQIGGLLWQGSIEHRHRYLYYDVRIRPPYDPGDSTIKLYYGNQSYVLGAQSTPGPTYHPGPNDGWDAEEWFAIHRGAVDMSGWGLVEGQRYQVRIEHEGPGNLADGKVYLLGEQPASAAAAAGWTAMPPWSLGDTVTAARLQPLRNNLTWLSNRIAYRNYPTPERYILGVPSQWFWRYHRWLHYFCAPFEGVQALGPSLGFWRGRSQKGWEETSLPYEPNTWLVYDLDSIDGLWEGSVYRLRDATFALEDFLP